MKRYAVAYISFFDNVLKLEVVKAKGWKEALSKVAGAELVAYLPDCIEEAKAEAFSGDWMFEVKVVK